MFSVVVLLTIFLGLVGVLALSDQCRRRRRRASDPRTNLTRLSAWLGDRGRDLPSVAMVLGVLNRVAKRELQSEDWQELQISSLLSGTELPLVSVRTIQQQTPQYIVSGAVRQDPWVLCSMAEWLLGKCACTCI
jgi:hypothetical protein